MAGQKLQNSDGVWSLVRRQHGAVTKSQLIGLGYTRHAIEHRVKKGRLHPLWRGVYAVGRREVTREGMWIAAVLTCGEGAVLSHHSAAALWALRKEKIRTIHVTV